MKSIEIKFFALFREKVGQEKVIITTEADTYSELYQLISQKYRLGLPIDMVQIAVNDEFSNMDLKINDGDKIVFIPPVAGG